MSTTSSSEDEIKDNKDIAKQALKEKIDFILNFGEIEDLNTEFKEVGLTIESLTDFLRDMLQRFPLLFTLFIPAKKNKEKLQIRNYIYEKELQHRLKLFYRNKLKEYKPKKNNKEKLAAKQSLKSAIENSFVEVELEIAPEQFGRLVDSSLDLIEYVAKLPKDKRETAYKIGEERVLSVLNPPSKFLSAGASTG